LVPWAPWLPSIFQFYSVVCDCIEVWHQALGSEDEVTRLAGTVLGKQMQLSASIVDLMLATRRPWRRLHLLFRRTIKMSTLQPRFSSLSEATARCAEAMAAMERAKSANA